MENLSEYEVTRQQNIERNNAFLKEIGLFEVKDSLDNNNNDSNNTTNNNNQNKSNKRKSNSNNEENKQEVEQVRRKSSRLSKSTTLTSVEEEEKAEPLLQLPDTFKEPTKSQIRAKSVPDVEILLDQESERNEKLTSENLYNFMEQRNKEHAENATAEAIQHTVHRINSMSTKQLALRMRKITITDKMLLFYYALECVGLKDLANSAKLILKKIHHIDVDENNLSNNKEEKEGEEKSGVEEKKDEI